MPPRSQKKKDIEFIKWSSKEKRFEQLIASLKAAKMNALEAKKAINILQELLQVLEASIFTSKEGDQVMQRIREIFFDLWHLLLINVRNHAVFLLIKRDYIVSNNGELHGSKGELKDMYESQQKKYEATARSLYDCRDYVNTFSDCKNFQKWISSNDTLRAGGVSHYSESDIRVLHKAIGYVILYLYELLLYSSFFSQTFLSIFY
jgi:hypothetical protein